MIALFDIGNTRAKFQLVSSGELPLIQYCENNDISNAWLDKHLANVSELILSNVSDVAITECFEKWAVQRNIIFKAITVENEALGIACGYDMPSRLGVDRWLVTLAAAKIYPNCDCVIVDSGTATTIDILKEGKLFQGGWILPGIDLMAESLLGSTKQINITKSHAPTLKFGTNTEQAVFNGAFAATISAIEASIDQLSYQELTPKVLLTGGYGKVLAESMQEECVYIEDLIFQGMLRFSRTT